MLALLTACGGPDADPVASVAIPRATPAPTSPPADGSAGPIAGPTSIDRQGISELDDAHRRLMTGKSWKPGCPVSLDDLRLLEPPYRDAAGDARTGELVVHRDVADAVMGALRATFAAGYPIERMRLVDHYDADDDASMLDNNTSAFNCRRVKGSTRWSEHSYGRAIDINPFKNPWVRGDTVDPPQAERYADRSVDDPQLIHRDDAVWRAFAAIGWDWGGDWQGSKDYQHFSASGR